MERGSSTGMKQKRNQTLQKKTMDSEGSDEDYVAEVDELDDQSDDLDSLLEKEEDDEEDGEEGGWRTVVKPKPRDHKGFSRSRKNGVKRPKKRRKVIIDDDDSSDDDDDEEFTPDGSEYLEKEAEVEAEAEEEKEGGWRTVVKQEPRDQKSFSRFNENGGNRLKKRKKITRDDDDDSDDDDEEFTLDEFEYMKEEDEEEDEELEEEESEEDEEFPKPKTKKRGRTTFERKTSVRTQRKRTTKTGRKPSERRSKRTNSSRRNAKSDGDEEFLEKGQTLRGRKKAKACPRRKRETVKSDSDICSDSSEREFTISDEEREQVREANLFCRTSVKNSRSPRKIEEDGAFCEPKKSRAKKGKEKAEETKNDMGKPVCGICLTEEGKTSVRGTLNCCNHYFCFACIMEWSKVETRCPLCKQRFVTISKPTKCGKGFDQSYVMVNVPERDQVYQPSEEELRDFLNPYENVICTECHEGGDDALMLLCDVCDSPAHTYCVGLGQEVPEGNWYCDGCRPAILASSHSQFHELMANQRASAGVSGGQSRYENMAEIDLNVTIPETPLSQGDGLPSSSRFPEGSLQRPSQVSGIGVSTVSGRRRIHHQIQYILSNRVSLTGGVISSLDSMIGLGVNTPFHHGIPDVGTSHHGQQFGRFHENYHHNFQNTNFGPGRLSNMTGHVGQPLTATDGSSIGYRAWSGLERVHLEPTQAQLTVSGPLQPCTSRSSNGYDTGGFFSGNRQGDYTNFVRQEVNSIVTNELESMPRNTNLSHVISMRSEHTIMAAFGLEPQRHDTFVVQPPICIHLLNRLPHVEISPLNNCCLVCFQDFVKIVVKRVVDIMMGSWAPHWLDFRH